MPVFEVACCDHGRLRASRAHHSTSGRIDIQPAPVRPSQPGIATEIEHPVPDAERKQRAVAWGASAARFTTDSSSHGFSGPAMGTSRPIGAAAPSQACPRVIRFQLVEGVFMSVRCAVTTALTPAPPTDVVAVGVGR